MGERRRLSAIARNLVRGSVRRARILVPDLADLHIYGGGALAAWGAAICWGPGAGLILFGAWLAILGILSLSAARRKGE